LSQSFIYVVLKLFECNKDHRDIIDTVIPSSRLYYLIGYKTTNRVKICCLWSSNT